MASPHPNTALLLEQLLAQLARLESCEDTALALQEFALGQPLAERDLDICFGYAPLPPQEKAHLPALLALSRGVGRVGGTLASPLESITPVDLPAELGSVSIENAYAFGRVALALSGGVPVISVQMARGGVESVGTPLFVSRDVSVPVAQTWLLRGDVTLPALPVSGIEIALFVLDIHAYAPDSGEGGTPSNRITAYLFDRRRPRGWGGFAEETLAARLVPSSIVFARNLALDITDIRTALYNLIADWFLLPGWEPSFADYWQTSGETLPARLKAHLETEYGIDI